MRHPDSQPVRSEPVLARRYRRRRLHLRLRPVLLFAGVLLFVNALVGERSALQRVRARREDRALASAISALRRENLELRERARRLREDPSSIEPLARRELGLIRPGEVLVVVSPAATRGREADGRTESPRERPKAPRVDPTR